MVKKILSHYSPKFANKEWSDNGGIVSFYQCMYSSAVKKTEKGSKAWGRQRGLYPLEIENSLNMELENFAAPIYKKILDFQELTKIDRKVWSQFLLSQLVRTPTFMKYENFAMNISGLSKRPLHDRVGCRYCNDLNFIANRDWGLLIAHEDDFFVRSDNPVFQTGFIERPESCLLYPLSPRLCFVACSMQVDWNGHSHVPHEMCGRTLRRGDAHLFNFYLAKAAGASLIISPKHDGVLVDSMFSDILGTYPQPPFSLHHLRNHFEFGQGYESIRFIMSEADGKIYPKWLPTEIEPFFMG